MNLPALTSGGKAGALRESTPRGTAVCFLRSVGCGTEQSLVFPAGFAATVGKLESTGAGTFTKPRKERSLRGVGGVGLLTSLRVGALGFFPMGFTPLGHFFKDGPAVCSARIFNVVFSPGF